MAQPEGDLTRHAKNSAPGAKVPGGALSASMSPLVDPVLAAEDLRGRLERLTLGGGVLDQIAAGEFEFTSDQHRRDVAELLSAAAEAARAARELAGGPEDIYAAPAALRASDLGRRRLPLNRKERYFTGTVLPMLIASDGFAHLHRFLALCGLGDVAIQAGREPYDPDLQFLTEYGFGESLVGAARERFIDAPAGKDTPDVVLAGPDWLLAVEAKLYDRSTTATLTVQLAAQRVLLDYWADKLDIPSDRCVHVALLPRRLSDDMGVLPARVVTWEMVLHAYRRVGPAYWVGVLAAALEAFEELVAKRASWGQNADAYRTGAEIVAGVPYLWMGRVNGIEGEDLRQDLATGAWRSRTYEVRTEPLPGNANWFPIAEFLARVADQQ